MVIKRVYYYGSMVTVASMPGMVVVHVIDVGVQVPVQLTLLVVLAVYWLPPVHSYTDMLLVPQLALPGTLTS